MSKGVSDLEKELAVVYKRSKELCTKDLVFDGKDTAALFKAHETKGSYERVVLRL